MGMGPDEVKVPCFDDWLAGVGAMSHKVAEVGQDYAVLKDIVGVAESRIPIYAIKALVRQKLKE
jgi:hypothetical protein